MAHGLAVRPESSSHRRTDDHHTLAALTVGVCEATPLHERDACGVEEPGTDYRTIGLERVLVLGWLVPVDREVDPLLADRQWKAIDQPNRVDAG